MTQDRLRVCLVVPGFSSHMEDGCIPALRAFALALAAHHDVTVVPLRFPFRVGPDPIRPYRLGPLHVLPLGGGDARGHHRVELLRRAVTTVVAAGPFDVVHGLWADEPGLVATLAGRWLRARTVVSLMGGELAALSALPYGGGLERLGPHLVRLAAAGCDQLTVGSPWLLDRVPQPWRAKTRLMPLAVAPLFFQRAREARARPSGPLRIGQIASLSPVKAPGLLLSAAALARHRGAHLRVTLIGEGPLRDRLLRQAARLGLPVDFAGAIPPSVMPTRLAALDVVVQSSWWESQGMAVLEAGAMACAVLGTEVGSLADLSAALARTPAGQVAPLATALVAAAADRDRTFAAGQAAAREVAIRYAPAGAIQAWHLAAVTTRAP